MRICNHNLNVIIDRATLEFVGGDEHSSQIYIRVTQPSGQSVKLHFNELACHPFRRQIAAVIWDKVCYHTALPSTKMINIDQLCREELLRRDRATERKKAAEINEALLRNQEFAAGVMLDGETQEATVTSRKPWEEGSSDEGWTTTDGW